MKTLGSSSAKLFSGGKNGDGGGFLLAKDQVIHVLGRTEICFSKNYQKHVNVGLISLQHKKTTMMIRPLFASSSSSSHSSLSYESQEELEAAEARIQEINQSKTVHVKLQLQKECLFGEKFLIVGDDPMFGLWDPSDAIPLDWSEYHLWTAELDVPIGRTIQFKFILIENTGNILWQPGPDRILRTWETKNTITVLEDWKNAEVQKIMEEGPIQIINEVSIVNDVLIAGENLNLPKAKQMNDENKTSEKKSMETYNELIVAQNITQLPMAMVAENITYPKEDNGTTIAENIVGNNGKAAALSNLANSQNEEILVIHEGGPVLVPGLTPFSALQTEEAPLYQDDRSIAIDSSVGPDETKKWNASEQEPDSDLHQEVTKMISRGEELHTSEFQQDPDSEPHQEVAKMISKGEELHISELQQDPDLARVKEQLQSDMQWGRQTLRKLLSTLGLI